MMIHSRSTQTYALNDYLTSSLAALPPLRSTPDSAERRQTQKNIVSSSASPVELTKSIHKFILHTMRSRKTCSHDFHPLSCIPALPPRLFSVHPPASACPRPLSAAISCRLSMRPPHFILVHRLVASCSSPLVVATTITINTRFVPVRCYGHVDAP